MSSLPFARTLTPSLLLLIGLATIAVADEPANETVVVRPEEIDDVLTNPGIGFTTFQSFQGDRIRRSSRGGGYYPECSIAYFRFYWDEIEPREGEYRWNVIDDALAAARRHGQTLMLRVSAHGYTRRHENTRLQNDVPRWYRDMVGRDYEKLDVEKWSTDPEDPRYAKYFGRLIRELGHRYDGHPDLESVDLAIVGAWGEGAGAARLSDRTMQALVDAYVDSFDKTPLVALLMDARTNKYALSKRAVGWRADCLGDLGGFEPDWSHMLDRYPEALIKNGLTDAWRQAPRCGCGIGGPKGAAVERPA